ncbi:MAG: hypothetical protein NC184_07085 [Roseburia sp.]|nr:hypothetical protein [Roseburia sp.]
MNKRTLKICAAAVVCAVSAAFTAAFAPRSTAEAEASLTVELTPVEIAGSAVNYRYFDGARSVFADETGILVSDRTGISSVAKAVPDGYVVTDNFSADADKAYRYGTYYVTLEDGVIFARNADGASEFASDPIADFDIENGMIYALSADKLYMLPLGENSFDENEATVVELESYDYTDIKASAVAVMNGSVFAAVDSAVFSGNKQDICRINTTSGALTSLVMQSDNIYSLTALDGSEALYALTRNKITGYTASGGGLSARYTAPDSQTIDIFAYHGCVYTLDALGALHELSAELARDNVLLASASDADGFFNMPTSAAVKNSTLYVADYINGRVAVYGKTYSRIDVDSPVSVACDANGNVYAAYDSNKIRALSSDGATITVGNGVIKQIAVDADGRIFALADDGLYLSDNGRTANKISDTRYKAITLSVGREELYALDGAAVKKITVTDGKAAEAAYCNTSADAFSIAADINGNIFALSVDGITRTARGSASPTETYGLTVGGAAYRLGFSSGQILLSTVQNSYVGYGDIIIADTYKHRVFTTGGKADVLDILDIDLIDENYAVPNVVGGKSPTRTETASGLIRVALTDIEVFSLPMETPSVYTIAKGRNVIVPQYDIADTREYALILIDNLETGKLIQGYVHKNALSAPLPYVEPPSKDGTVYNSATPVYMWPSPNANTVAGYSAVERSTKFTVLDFVNAYRDDYGHLWYRISISGGYEGFILGANLSMMDYEPVFIRPAYNAEIISYEGSTSAPTYFLDDGKYVELSVRLDTGTQVEIVGAFDSSERYTQVKYLDPELGTLTCYVETVYLKYNGVNIVLIVAVVVIIITIIIAAVVIWRVVHIKRRRLEAQNDSDDD